MPVVAAYHRQAEPLAGRRNRACRPAFHLEFLDIHRRRRLRSRVKVWTRWTVLLFVERVVRGPYPTLGDWLPWLTRAYRQHLLADTHIVTGFIPFSRTRDVVGIRLWLPMPSRTEPPCARCLCGSSRNCYLGQVGLQRGRYLHFRESLLNPVVNTWVKIFGGVAEHCLLPAWPNIFEHVSVIGVQQVIAIILL